MRQAIPPITESVADLKPRLPRAHDSHKQRRLQLLYLLARQPAHERREVAQLLGGHRTTMGRWLATSAAGGLAALRAPDVPAGKPISLAPDVLASLERALRRPDGSASYEALRQWVARAPGVQSKDQTLYTLVRTRFRATLTGPRPRHTKNP